MLAKRRPGPSGALPRTVLRMDLTGATALVTGSNRGIGRAISEALAERPLDLLLCGMRAPEKFSPIAVPTGGAKEVRPVTMDLSSRETIDRSCDDLPPVDLLVNNAGLMTGGLLEDQEMADVYAMFQVNLVGLVHVTRRLLPGMVERGRGKIVNNASISGYAWFPAVTTYAASKTGVVAFSEALRRELDGTGVGVLHLVTPGVATDMLDDTREVYGRHMSADAWDDVPPEEWAGKVLRAIENDDHVLGPGGKLALAKLASRGPAALMDAI
jgi:short-subunit dehydrogenase